ncbi:MAG: chromate efflux transporter [Spirulina sp. SIO3F2]|nr:chromate efflux transporter [Spirulina sp. SIO3F2]
MNDPASDPLPQRLRGLAQIFLRLGTVGFGGPQAHMAMQNDEVVVKRQWLTQEEFTTGLAMCEMLPGPASTQLGIYIGYVRAGMIGALVSGLSFIAPAFVIVVALSWGYFRFQGVPQLTDLFLGVSPVVTAIILAFCWKLGKKSLKGWVQVVIAIAAFALLTFSPINILLLFVLAGLVGLFAFQPPSTKEKPPIQSLLFPPLPLLLANLPAETLALSSVWGLERIGAYALPLAVFFLQVGSFIFGGGLVIIPLLEFEVVEQLHWLTRTEFINGVAIGQLSPGPVVLTAAFVGYKVAGVLGALVSAIAIFTPSFAFILLATPLLLRIRKNPWIKAFLQGVTPAVLGAIAAAAIPLAQTALLQPTVWVSVATSAIMAAALVALIKYKTPTWSLIPAGAVLGLVIGTLA